MAELVDARDLGSRSARSIGSSPITRTKMAVRLRRDGNKSVWLAIAVAVPQTNRGLALELRDTQFRPTLQSRSIFPCQRTMTIDFLNRAA